MGNRTLQETLITSYPVFPIYSELLRIHYFATRKIFLIIWSGQLLLPVFEWLLTAQWVKASQCLGCLTRPECLAPAYLSGCSGSFLPLSTGLSSSSESTSFVKRTFSVGLGPRHPPLPVGITAQCHHHLLSDVLCCPLSGVFPRSMYKPVHCAVSSPCSQPLAHVCT